MQVLVGADDGGGDLRPLQQIEVALGDEIRADFAGDFAGAVGVFLCNPDPSHRRMACRDLATKQSDAAAADDSEANVLGAFHVFRPARFLTLSSAIAEIDSLVSGRSTGSPRSADKSAAL